MKINHHQIKNAIAHVSKRVEKDFPNKKHALSHASFNRPLEIRSASDFHNYSYWRFVVYKLTPVQPDGSKILDSSPGYLPPGYGVKLVDTGTDESISLDNIFIEIRGIDKAIDAGWGFMNHVDKITTGELIGILPANSYLKRYPSWMLKYDCIDNKQADVEMLLYVSNQGVIFNVEFIYTKGEKARELAENFMKQSGEVQNPQKVYQDYRGGNKGIHDLWYRGFNPQGEAVQVIFEIDVKDETILSHKIAILKSGNEQKG